MAEEEEGEENIDDEEDEEEEEKGDPVMSKADMIEIEEENSSEEKMHSALKWGRSVCFLMYLFAILV